VKHKYVYIAGPYTGGDVAVNVRRAMEAGDAVEATGYVAHIPHLCHFRHLHREQPYSHWMKLDLAWLEKCDVLVRLPGESPGADNEVAYADKRGIPVLRITESERNDPDDLWVSLLADLPLRGM